MQPQHADPITLPRLPFSSSNMHASSNAHRAALLGVFAFAMSLLMVGCASFTSPARISENDIAFTLQSAGGPSHEVTHGMVMRSPVKTLRAIELVHHDGRRETGTWTGTPVPRLFASLGLPIDGSSSAVVHVRAKDGYERAIPAAALEEAIIAWQHDGERFELAHEDWGPFRLVIPGRSGEDWVYQLDTIAIDPR